ncbi:MAG: aminotransferase class I/II-fold pyridoxal phosphate-dependent enzyme, partial [Gemmatimonadetes bacterium]|nr:aminotransferase class I/II-fold pyridoxal phosphate-dependent enzyme [Gemmatimonadota bacterium]
MPEQSRGLGALPGYPLAAVPMLKRRLAAQGVDVIDLGAGDALLLPPAHVLDALRRASGDVGMSRYGFQLGHVPYREAIAGWMGRRFGVELDPFEQILPLLGSKEGLAHLPLAYLNPGDVGIIPDPGYQAYEGGILLAGGDVVRLPLRAEKGFLMDVGELDGDVLGRAKLLYANYPNNPTAAAPTTEYLERLVGFCREHDLLLAYDNAYSEIAFDGYVPPSILQIPGALDVAVEFHSLSKTYNMTGWRLGWAAGNGEALRALSQAKTFIDTGAFKALQAAGAAALEHAESWVPGNVDLFRRRRDAVAAALARGGWAVEPPRATMYFWVPVPTGEASAEFTQRILEETGVVVLPGSALGAAGEGF